MTLTRPTKLVGFIANPNPQIRLLATENLVSYSTSDLGVFKAENLQPVKNLKLLVKDHPVSTTSQSRPWGRGATIVLLTEVTRKSPSMSSPSSSTCLQTTGFSSVWLQMTSSSRPY